MIRFGSNFPAMDKVLVRVMWPDRNTERDREIQSESEIERGARLIEREIEREKANL